MTTRIALQRATGREWAGLAVLALPTLLLSIDIFVLLLALPKIDEDLRASSTQQLWISDSYGFLLAGFLVTMGTLGDRVGRRKLLLICSPCPSWRCCSCSDRPCCPSTEVPKLAGWTSPASRYRSRPSSRRSAV